MTARKKPIKVMLVDDHLVVRQSLRELLKSNGPFAVVGEAQNGRDAVALAAKLSPDVILMDISMPLLNGLDATREILGANPAAKVIILSAYDDDAYVASASLAGAAGFLAKQNFSETLAQAIRDVVEGCAFFGPTKRPKGTVRLKVI